MTKKYKKDTEGNLVVEETTSKTRTYSYDRILNDIQEFEEKLVEVKELKREADKLGLKR